MQECRVLRSKEIHCLRPKVIVDGVSTTCNTLKKNGKGMQNISWNEMNMTI